MTGDMLSLDERIARLDAALAQIDETRKWYADRDRSWLDAHPRDPISDVYEYGINVPGRKSPYAGQIESLDAARMALVSHMLELRSRKYPSVVMPVRSTRPFVVVGVMVNDGNALMEWRPDFIAGGGWAFPGGKLNETESPALGLRREWFEEMAILITRAEPLPIVDAVSYVNLPFHVTAWSGAAPASTLDAGHKLEWRDLREQINDQRWLASQKIARLVLERLNQMPAQTR